MSPINIDLNMFQETPIVREYNEEDMKYFANLLKSSGKDKYDVVTLEIERLISEGCKEFPAYLKAEYLFNYPNKGYYYLSLNWKRLNSLNPSTKSKVGAFVIGKTWDWSLYLSVWDEDEGNHYNFLGTGCYSTEECTEVVAISPTNFAVVHEDVITVVQGGKVTYCQ